MVEIKAIAALFLAYILIGVSITGLIQASVYTVTCGFCQDGIKSVADDFTALVRAGQKNIDEGVTGLLELRQTEAQLKLTAGMAKGLYGQYRFQIYGGLLLMIGMWLLVGTLVKRFFDMFTGFEPPFWSIIFLTFIIVGLIETASGLYSGDGIKFYSGTWNLLTHWDIWSYRLLDALSPIPINASGNMSAVPHL